MASSRALKATCAVYAEAGNPRQAAANHEAGSDIQGLAGHRVLSLAVVRRRRGLLCLARRLVGLMAAYGATSGCAQHAMARDMPSDAAHRSALKAASRLRRGKGAEHEGNGPRSDQ